MRTKLLDRITRQLLKDFGAGGHEPGSGSAAAFSGLLSSHLTCTVIDLTEKYQDRSTVYKSHIAQLSSDRFLLKSEIIPKLEELFEKDAIEFDKVIAARKDHKRERNPKLKDEKRLIVDKQLRICTQLPALIASYCYKTGLIAANVFDYGYIGARGDSAEAIHIAASTILSCLSVIELNLQKLPVDTWMEKMRKQKQQLEEKFKEIDKLSRDRHSILKADAEEHYQYERMVMEYRKGNLATKIKNDSELENFVRDLQILLWTNKKKIWKKESEKIADYIHILKPQDVLTHLLDYKVIPKDSLGVHFDDNGAFQVAGILDRANRQVEIARDFTEDTMRFTAAHELGHALLHEGTILHRDRPLIPSQNVKRNAIERQADKFAAFFLMPSKMVKLVFEEIFETTSFRINEETVFKLGVGSIREFRKKCVDIRGLTRFLVTTRRFGEKSITPLAVIFGVSDEMMAIRLEELGLVEF